MSFSWETYHVSSSHFPKLRVLCQERLGKEYRLFISLQRSLTKCQLLNGAGTGNRTYDGFSDAVNAWLLAPSIFVFAETKTAYDT